MNDDWNSIPLMSDVVDACFEVYRTLGRGFVEKAYKLALSHELRMRGYTDILVEEWIDITYKGFRIEKAFRADLIVNHELIVELKATDELVPAHHDQLNSYMLLSGIPYGVLVNFHGKMLKENLSGKSLGSIRKFSQIRWKPKMNGLPDNSVHKN